MATAQWAGLYCYTVTVLKWLLFVQLLFCKKHQIKKLNIYCNNCFVSWNNAKLVLMQLVFGRGKGCSVTPKIKILFLYSCFKWKPNLQIKNCAECKWSEIMILFLKLDFYFILLNYYYLHYLLQDLFDSFSY